jgi:hypothetical protein
VIENNCNARGYGSYKWYDECVVSVEGEGGRIDRCRKSRTGKRPGQIIYYIDVGLAASFPKAAWVLVRVCLYHMTHQPLLEG